MISLRALVVYESMYGNTHVIASNIAIGLRGTYEVTLVPVAAATADLVAEADLLVVGAPSHMEPGSLIMERKMLLGIKQRAEDLACQGTSIPGPADGS